MTSFIASPLLVYTNSSSLSLSEHQIVFLYYRASGPGGLRSHDNWLRRLALLF
jgi:protein subunit release factor B